MDLKIMSCLSIVTITLLLGILSTGHGLDRASSSSYTIRVWDTGNVTDSSNVNLNSNPINSTSVVRARMEVSSSNPASSPNSSTRTQSQSQSQTSSYTRISNQHPAPSSNKDVKLPQLRNK